MRSTSFCTRRQDIESGLKNVVASLLIPMFAGSLAAAQTSPQTKSLAHYAMIFRSQRALTSDQQHQRDAEIQAWAKRVRDQGVTLDPRILGASDGYFEGDGDRSISRPDQDACSPGAVIFFDSASEEEAKEIAGSHPGLHYGVTIELREWQAPSPGSKGGS